MKIAPLVCFLTLLMNSASAYSYGIIEYLSVDRPITTAKLFRECNPENPGTTRSSLCNIWDEHIQYLEKRLEQACVTAGEKIYKTVAEAEGFYLKGPEPSPYASHLHKLGASSSADMNYVWPGLMRFYRELEFYSPHKKKYAKYFIPSIAESFSMKQKSYSYADKVTSRYKVEYKPLTDRDDHVLGFHGDSTWITDLTTGEKLAERTVYYYIINSRRIQLVDGSKLAMPQDYRYAQYFVPCKNYQPRVLWFEANESGHPTSAYEFVSRVLIPKAPTHEENLLIYDLLPGSGKKGSDCVRPVKLGPGVTPDNLRVTRIKDSLSLSIENTADQIVCSRFFIGPHWKLRLLFSDGTYWNEQQVLDHGNITWKKH